MIFDKPYGFTKSTTTITNDDQIILGNSRTGAWIRMSKDCYDILTYGVNSNLSIAELLNILADDEDRKYVLRLFTSIEHLQILLYEDEAELIDNKSYSIAITHRCNLYCKHCSFNAECSTDPDYLDTSALKDVLIKLISTNPQNIILTGGEPMYRPDFIEILTFISDNYNGNIGLMTNGTLFNDENTNTICSKITMLDISLDGVDEETVSIIRGEGVFEKVIKTVKQCQSYGLGKISLSMIDSELTKECIPRFYELNRELKTEAVVRKFVPEGRGKENKALFMSSEVKLPDKFSAIISVRDRDESAKNVFVRKCGACTRYLSVSPKGFVFPCPLLDDDKYRICDLTTISDEDFKNICSSGLISTSAYQAYRGILPINCRECNVNEFCINCIAYFLRFMSMDSNYRDRTCDNIKCQLNQIVWNR